MPNPISKRRTKIPAQPKTLYHVIVMGQSNGTGIDTKPLLSNVQSYGNLMFSGGTRPYSMAGKLGAFQPLTEVLETDPVSGSNQDGECALSGCLNYLAEKTGSVFIGSNVALNAARITAINKTTTPYNDALAQIRAAKALAASRFLKYQVLAVIFIHGETDQQFNVTNYASLVTTMQSDFEADAKAITGQTVGVPFFACQQGVYPPGSAGTQPTSGAPYGSSTAYQLFQAFLANPTKVYLLNSRYLHYTNADGIHISNHAQRWQGEMYGKAIYQALFAPGSWTPLYPSLASLSTNVVTVSFSVPVVPLVFDYQMVAVRDTVKKGFEYFDDSGAIPAITDVSISGTQVLITLASNPTGTFKQIRYGHSAGGGSAGPFGGVRGNLRDSDATQSKNGYPMYNWCAQFAITL
jgi:hypothetical protein